MHKQLFQVPGLYWLNVSRHEKVNDFNAKWKAQYGHKITQFNAEGVLRILKIFSVLCLYRSAEESLLQKKMRVRDMKDIQKPVCFEMEYFDDYSFDFASA